MSERIPNLHIGDVVRIFTYGGTKVSTSSWYIHIVEEDRFADLIHNPLDGEKDGLRFVGTYVGTEEMRVAMNVDVLKQTLKPYLKLQVLAQNFKRGHPAGHNEGPDTVDLRIPERLVRRYEILESIYKSMILPLERVVEEEAAQR